MSKHPLVNSLGLKVSKVDAGEVHWYEAVNATDLEAALQKLPKVKGFYEGDVHIWGNGDNKKDTHEAFLLGVMEIEREPLKVEFDGQVTEMSRMMDGFSNWYLFHDKMKDLAGKKVRVTVEEIK